MAKRNLIVGAGISGCTLANLIATQLHEKITLIDARDHIGGNCYDYVDADTGIHVHKYGAHIFHTNIESVWSYLSNFTKWSPYAHMVRGVIDGQEVPIPFNLNSIYQCFDKDKAQRLEQKLISQYGLNVKVPIYNLLHSGDSELASLGDYVFNKVFVNYTVKQWGIHPQDLDPLVINRVPVYVSYDNRYFQDLYQGIPVNGYTSMIEKMLDNPLIEVKLNTPYTKDLSYDRLFWTGAIDEFFDYKYGKLPYRSLKFDFQKLNQNYFLSHSVINHPNDSDYTRVIEFKHFLNEKSDKTVITYEYPQAFELGVNERYYPVITEESSKNYSTYFDEASRHENCYFLGRLADFKYYDMDKAVARAIDVFDSIKDKD